MIFYTIISIGEDEPPVRGSSTPNAGPVSVEPASSVHSLSSSQFSTTTIFGSIAPTSRIFSLPTLSHTTQPAPSGAPPVHPKPAIGVIVPIAVVLWLAVAAAALFLTVRARLRPRRRQVVQDVGHVQYGDLQGNHDSAVRDSLMPEHDTSRISSLSVGFVGGRHSAGAEGGRGGGGGVSGQDDM